MSPEVVAMLMGLMNFAAYSTGLPTPNELPNIEWHERCEINNEMYGACDPTAASYAAAMFDRETQTITLAIEDVDLATLSGKATVLHELVHWVQFVALLEGNAIMVDIVNSAGCPNQALEPGAYRAQFEWVRENRRDPWTTMPMDWYTYYSAIACRPVYEEMRGES